MAQLTKDLMLEMYWTMLLARRTDERAWVLHRQGKIAFHISAIGHEAAQVGSAFALRRGHDWVTPYYRDLSFMMALGMTPEGFIMGLMGKKADPNSGGRQMPSHWSSRQMNAVSHSAPVATQTSHAAGIGLAIKLRKDDRVVLSNIGEGSTAQGEWYEGVNWAAIHQLPVVFVIQNNQYAISERPDRQMAVKSAAEKACGLGLPGVSVDGTDVYAVYKEVSEAVERARRGEGPSVIEARAYRITPHSSDDDDRSYRSREEVEDNKKKDPMIVSRAVLEKKGYLDETAYKQMDEKARKIVEGAVEAATAAPYPAAEEALHPVYAEEIPGFEASLHQNNREAAHG